MKYGKFNFEPQIPFKEKKMAQCQGTKKNMSNSVKCASGLHRCKKCNNVGCSYGARDLCTNQGFLGSTCLKCGAVGQKEQVS